MDFLQSLLDSSSVPAITAFILGILTAVSPCPLATNITAIGFISKDIENRHRIFINGLLYTFGRIVTYTVLGFILIPILREGASMFMVQKAVSKYGEMLIAPVLIIIGIFMLDIIKLNLPKINIGGESLKKKTKGGWGAILAKVKELYKDEEINDIDGVKIDFPDKWVHLRKSNTEPIIRVYSEAATMEAADEIGQKIMDVVYSLAK